MVLQHDAGLRTMEIICRAGDQKVLIWLVRVGWSPQCQAAADKPYRQAEIEQHTSTQATAPGMRIGIIRRGGSSAGGW